MAMFRFENILKKSSLSADVQKKLLDAVNKLNTEEQALLLQLFEKYPEKIAAFWEVSKKKFEFLKDGGGNLESLLQEEVELFS